MRLRITPDPNDKTAWIETLSKTRILVVDDDELIRGLHETVLNQAGYDTESASNGEEALVKLATRNFDMVLTDRAMPVLDGASLIRALRSAGNRIPVMIVSGSLAGCTPLPADIRDEVAVTLPKPAGLRELATGVAHTLRWLPAAQDAKRIMETEAFTAAA